jgi:hypothetical protein
MTSESAAVQTPWAVHGDEAPMTEKARKTWQPPDDVHNTKDFLHWVYEGSVRTTLLINIEINRSMSYNYVPLP